MEDGPGCLLQLLVAGDDKVHPGLCPHLQHGKSSHAKLPGLLKPNKIPDGPAQVVTIDFIFGLPSVVVNGRTYNALHLVADRHTKLIHLIPCTEEIDSDGAADNFIREQFHLHGLPQKIISDHRPQFASKLFSAILKGIGVEGTLSTAYHPRHTSACSVRDGATTGVKWLPIAEFAFNSHVHLSTSYSLFYLIYGYEPQFHVPAALTDVPATDV